VLFNVEFLEVLIFEFGVPSINITFLADCRLESEMATKIYRVNNIVVNNIKDIHEVLKTMDKHFDLCFSNPPYNKGIYCKIVSHIVPVCTEVIVIHLGAWILDNKNLERSFFTKYKNEIKNVLEEVDIIDGNKIFNIIGACTPYSIIHINKNYSGNIKVNYFDKSFEVSDIEDITIFTSDWKPKVKPFIDIVKKEQNIWEWNHRIRKNRPKDKIYVQLRDMVPGTSGNDIWDCLIQLNSNYEKYIIDFECPKRYSTEFWFDSMDEAINFIDYLKTDFVRFCISILKHNQNFYTGELLLVPVVDFSKSWNDEKLYKHFSIPKETIDYITSFIPDYFNLRKKNETI